MKEGTANLAEDYCFIHKALRPVGICRRAAVKFEAWQCDIYDNSFDVSAPSIQWICFYGTQLNWISLKVD